MTYRNKKSGPLVDAPTPADRLARALMKRKKAELIGVVVDLARDDRRLMRRLEQAFGVSAPAGDLVAAARQAIADATAFDERDIDYNFDYDDDAYRALERQLALLVGQGHLREAMTLALELMRHGSAQVEVSDEGLMTPDIEACLQVVIDALREGALPASEIVAWCGAMTDNDRVGFIGDKALQRLRVQYMRRSRDEAR